MTKQELASKLADTVGITRKQGNELLDVLSDTVADVLCKGGEITLPGLGKLSVKARPARKGRNPSTGEEIDIPAKNAPHFSAAKALKDAVN